MDLEQQPWQWISFVPRSPRSGTFIIHSLVFLEVIMPSYSTIYLIQGFSDLQRHTSLEEWYEPEAIGCGYGTTSVVFAPVKEGLLKFRCINLILAHTGRWIDKTSSEFLLFDYTASIMYFLGVFAGEWPSSDERAWFTRNSPTRSTVYDSYAGPIFLTYIQVHLRFFEAVNTLNHDRTTGERNGLKCNREQGSIISESGTTYFEEKRISIFGVLSFTEFAPENRRYEAPTFYNISVLGDFESFPHRSGEFEWRAGLEGTIAFHAALYASVNIWQVTWNQLLDAIDEHLRVRIGDTLDPKKIDTWMFDETGFQRSKSYVTSLQVLRIFDECVRTVSYDFRVLGRLFIQTRQFPMLHMQPEAIRILESNWRWVETFQKQAEESILGRIAQKTEEVKSLRDGLFNATSLREANLSSREASRATSMGRYVLVFTVVTILYLPPSFISTVFALDIFKKDLAQSKWEFKVSLVAVSLFTYLIAFASIIAVDWNGFKRRGKAMLEGFLQTLAPPISDS
ncbi:hypothetical protein F4777DRAFT_204788 [Nemania sp. FL0916]|nr:hypothetical protein F4777DRAFT_204788 [Nemania sp. FL0916]